MEEPIPSSAESDPVDRLVAEYLERQERGESADQEAFLAAHPEHAAELRSFFAALNLLPAADGGRITITPVAPGEAPAQRPDESLSSERLSLDDTSTAAPGQNGSRPPEIDPLPDPFGRYRIEKLLGRGGMGAVYLARDTQLHRHVALKVPFLSGPDADELVARFYREAQSAATLRHPNLCPVFDVGQIEGRHYLTMAYIEGLPLTRYVGRRKLQSEKAVVSLIRTLAIALAEAHRHGIVHRDLKPSNIMIDERGEPIVMDFGLAHRPQGLGESQLTRSGMIVGTPAYMSPEQIAGESAQLGPQSDIWSLGVVLYELLSGRLPFQGTELKIVGDIRHADPPRLSSVNPSVDPRLEAVCRKMMERSLARRYQTMDEVSRALASIQQGPRNPEQGSHADERVSAEGDAAASAPRISPTADAVNREARSRTTMVLLAGLCCVLAAGTTFPWWRGALESPSQDPPHIAATPEKSPGAVAPVPATSAALWQDWPPDAPKPAIAPFSAEAANRLQVQWADYLGVSVEYTNSIGMKFRLVPPGEYVRGSTDNEIDQALELVKGDAHWINCLRSQTPRHRVVLTRPMYVGIHEVTQSQFQLVLGTTPSLFREGGKNEKVVRGQDTSDFPVENVDWFEATEFAVRLSRREKRNAFYVRENESTDPEDGDGYRLPTEAEHEFFHRAGTNTRFTVSPESSLDRVAWYSAVANRQPHPVGQLDANAFGLYDVGGNVWEWCRDRWDEHTYAQFFATPAVDPNGPLEGDRRVLRGGSWKRTEAFCAPSIRYANGPKGRSDTYGFRVVLPVDSAQIPNRPKAVQPAPEGSSASTQPRVHDWPAGTPPPAIAPLTAAEAKRIQAAWADYLNVDVEYTNSVGMKFRLIPPGEYVRGSSPDEIREMLKVDPVYEYLWDNALSEGPAHKVVIRQPFYMGVSEVTQDQYQRVMGVNPSFYSASGPKGEHSKKVAGLDTSNHPAEGMNWHDAVRLCEKLSEIEKRKPLDVREEDAIVSRSRTGYRLPTEAEWEFAARAGAPTRYWNGTAESDLARLGWYARNSGGRTHAAMELLPNPYGLYDLHGNVWEWCDDFWDLNSYKQFPDAPAVDPRGPAQGTQKVIRGGSISYRSLWCSATTRSGAFPDSGSHRIGVRLVLAVDPPPAERAPWREWPEDAPLPAIAPFSIHVADAYQRAWAQYLKVDVDYVNSIGMKFRLIPPGKYLRGSPPDEIEESRREASTERSRENVAGEGPQHEVILTRPFYIAVHEVTQREFQRVLGVNPSHFARSGQIAEYASQTAGLDTSEFPVEGVSWERAAEFCVLLSELEGRTSAYRIEGEHATISDGTGYRIPTEGEWEFAGRGGTTKRFWAGSDPGLAGRVGWFDLNSSGRPHPVEQRPANPFGLFDMNGNVWELTQDFWSPTWYRHYEGMPAIDPQGPLSGNGHVIRGGSFNYGDWCGIAARDGLVGTSYRTGFRPVLPIGNSSRSRLEIPR